MTMKHRNSGSVFAACEILGLVILLFAAFWEFFIEVDLRDSKLCAIERRLDIVALDVGAICNDLQFVGLPDTHISAPDFHRFNSEQYQKIDRELGVAVQQSRLFPRIRGGIFIVGSALIVIGKVYEAMTRWGIERPQQRRP
jgi:hypothetical protein